MTYSEVLAANLESGTWIIYENKLLNLETLEVENDTSDAIHILRNLFTSISRSGRFVGEGHMDGPEQSSHGAACLDSRYRSREIQESGRGGAFLITGS